MKNTALGILSAKYSGGNITSKDPGIDTNRLSPLLLMYLVFIPRGSLEIKKDDKGQGTVIS